MNPNLNYILDSKKDDHGWTKTNGAFITTYTGRHFSYDAPSVDDVDIEDIAHALSQLCRFAGHTSRFMSVAEHSLYVCDLSENKLEGLLHDADEAYMIDVPSPLKAMIPDYKKIERRVAAVVMARFGLSYPTSVDTKDSDTAQLISEAKALIKNSSTWTGLWTTSKTGIPPKCYAPEVAKELFLKRYYEIM